MQVCWVWSPLVTDLEWRFLRHQELASGRNTEPSILRGATSDLFLQNQLGLQASSRVCEKYLILAK